MAGVAVHAVVDISVHVRVIEVGCIVAAVATGARKHRVIRRVRMARGADTVRITVVQIEERVVSGRQGCG